MQSAPLPLAWGKIRMLGASVPGLGGVGLAAILVSATTILAAASVTTTIGTATASESAAASAPTSAASVDGCHVGRGVGNSWLSFIQ